jgi:hydroxymethylpyrimidine/phosphomethylpyrimidine kinase
MRVALTVAGSDPSGGAGIQADLKTFHQFGVYGMAAITALTAQNTQGVSGVHVVPPEFLRAQLAALAGDIQPHTVKTGMLADAALATTVADCLLEFGWTPVVVDPVMIATSGDRLLTAEAESVIRDRLMPLAALVTPNLAEASLLTGRAVRGVEDMEPAGRALLAAGAQAALIKGGHLAGDRIVDVLVTRSGTRRFEHPRIATTSTHGTGCTLSAAITAGLALGRTLEQSVENGLGYVVRAIASAPGLGRGSGPVNHHAAGNGSM